MGSGVEPLAITTRSSKRRVYRDVTCPFIARDRLPLRVTFIVVMPYDMTGVNQADREISTGKLHTLLRFHTRPINVVVYHGSQARPRFEGGFPLRCFQRLSCPYLATRLCRWRDNRSTRGTSIPVLSY